MNPTYEFYGPVMYTTGAYVQPIKLIDENGKEVWTWVIREFVDDTFLDGDVANPREYGYTKRELLKVS